jgi:hypothetical protein
VIERLLWRLRRLSAMSFAETGHRVQQAACAGLERAGFLRAASRPVIHAAPMPPSWFSLDPPGIDVQALVVAADRLMAGHWQVFALDDALLGFPPDWHRDPKTGKRTPPEAFGKSINYRLESQVGDIKYLWEINRHLELVTLAQAWRLTGDAKYLAACDAFLRDWLTKSPYPLGINWISSLELAIRLVNWSVAWHLLGGDASTLFEHERGRALKHQWLVAIHQHCHFIRGYLSLHSSANNHLLGELMGLFVAASVWPVFTDSTAWLQFAQQGFEREALVQNAADGVNREQAVYYQHEVMDMMLICQQVAQASGGSFAPAFLSRLECMAEFLVAISDVTGNVPMLGDADDALVVRWSQQQVGNPYRPLLATAAVLFGRADFKQAAGVFDEKSAWLLGRAGLARWHDLNTKRIAPTQASFPEGGLYLLGSEFGAPGEVKLVIDCAPLGYLGIAAHGHADALSFTLSSEGEEILVDPGTFSYHTQAAWRNHFRGTSAHNTVRIDGLDQSEIGGPFLWMRKAAATLLRHEAAASPQVFEGRHDGYQRLSDPVLHHRRIEYSEALSQITVIDSLECQRDHEIEVCWQFAEGMTVRQDGDILLADGARNQIRMACNAPLSLRLFCGSESPIAGWVSRRFDSKIPAWSATWHGRVGPGASVVTTISLRSKDAVMS